MTDSRTPIGRAWQPVASALPREFDPLRQERALESCSSQRAASVTHSQNTPEYFKATDNTEVYMERGFTHLFMCTAPPLLPLLLLLHKCLYSPSSALLFTVGPGRPQPVCPRGTQTGPSAIQCWHRTLLECYRLVES